MASGAGAMRQLAQSIGVSERTRFRTTDPQPHSSCATVVI